MYWLQWVRHLVKPIYGKISSVVIIMMWITMDSIWETITMKSTITMRKGIPLLMRRWSWAIRHLFRQPVYRQTSISRTICYMILRTHFRKCSLRRRLTEWSIMIHWLVLNHRIRDKGWMALWMIFRMRSREWKGLNQREEEEGYDLINILIILIIYIDILIYIIFIHILCRFMDTLFRLIIFKFSVGIWSIRLSCSILISFCALSMHSIHNESRYDFSTIWISWSTISSSYLLSGSSIYSCSDDTLYWSNYVSY